MSKSWQEGFGTLCNGHSPLRFCSGQHDLGFQHQHGQHDMRAKEGGLRSGRQPSISIGPPVTASAMATVRRCLWAPSRAGCCGRAAASDVSRDGSAACMGGGEWGGVGEQESFHADSHACMERERRDEGEVTGKWQVSSSGCSATASVEERVDWPLVGVLQLRFQAAGTGGRGCQVSRAGCYWRRGLQREILPCWRQPMPGAETCGIEREAAQQRHRVVVAGSQRPAGRAASG